MPKIFLSYRREDSEHVTGRIFDRLTDRFGREAVFMDIDTIPFGVDFRKHLDLAVGQCDILLAVIGESWVEARHKEGARLGQRRLDDPGDFVRIEIQSALTREIPVIPVLVGTAAMPREEQLPDGLKALAYRNAAEVRSGRDFHSHVDRLLKGVENLAQGNSPDQGALRPPPLALAPFDAHDARELQKAWADRLGLKVEEEIRLGDGTGGLALKLVLIPPGRFLMGSPNDEEGRGDDEGPQHEVEISKPFYLGKYEVTQEQYEAVTGINPSCFSAKGLRKDELAGKDSWLPRFLRGNRGDVVGPDTRGFPVEYVSWNEAVDFCRRLNEERPQKGWRFDLPTEAQWEYACRAGTTTPFHYGSAGQAAGSLGPPGRTCRVGSYEPNPWGLYDMHGNVREWCTDWYGAYSTEKQTDPKGPDDGKWYRVNRGGSWRCQMLRYHRSANRRWSEPTDRNGDLGFRVAQMPSGK